MASKTRRVYVKEPSIFNAPTLIQIIGVPLLTGVVTFAGFYYTTKDQLTQHTELIQQEVKERKEQVAADQASRDKLRDTLIQNSSDTQKAISSLAANAAVQSEQIKAINSTLDRVVTGLQTITANTAKR